jgi:glycosyltransferase involved in cell wall biosynthesis
MKRENDNHAEEEREEEEGEEEDKEDEEEEHHRKKKRKNDDVDEKNERIFDCSILMPVRNAGEWLDLAVMSILSQDCVCCEFIAVDDCSTDGSFERLIEIKKAYDDDGGGEDYEEDGSRNTIPFSSELGIGRTLNGVGVSEEEDGLVDCSVVERNVREDVNGVCGDAKRLVRKFAKFGHEMRVVKLERDEKARSGQGLALNKALNLARGEFIGEMEADDARPRDCFRKLCEALRKDSSLDAVFSKIALVGEIPGNENIGWAGMKRFETWQNSLMSSNEMANGRYLEIPAMRASGLYRRTFLEEKMNLNSKGESLRVYEDLWLINDKIIDCADAKMVPSTYHSEPHMFWPVDSSFFHRAFNAKMNCLKIPEQMYWWRQYKTQSTKVHDRCSLKQLRAAKVHYLLKKDGPLGYDALFKSSSSTTEDGNDGADNDDEEPKKLIIRVFGRGETLNSYVDDIAREIALNDDDDVDDNKNKLAIVVEKRDEMPGLPKRKRSKEVLGKNVKLARLFAFGMQKARSKILRVMQSDFDSGRLDWFVA